MARACAESSEKEFRTVNLGLQPEGADGDKMLASAAIVVKSLTKNTLTKRKKDGHCHSLRSPAPVAGGAVSVYRTAAAAKMPHAKEATTQCRFS
jgi:hypothetical protein